MQSGDGETSAIIDHDELEAGSPTEDEDEGGAHGHEEVEFKNLIYADYKEYR